MLSAIDRALAHRARYPCAAVDALDCLHEDLAVGEVQPSPPRPPSLAKRESFVWPAVCCPLLHVVALAVVQRRCCTKLLLRPGRVVTCWVRLRPLLGPTQDL